MKAQLSHMLPNFSRSKRGSIATMGGLMAGILAACAMATVDIAEMNSTKQVMQNRLDAATLFAARRSDIKDPGAKAQIQTQTEEFLLNSLRQAGVRADEVSATFRYDAESDSVVADVKFVPNTFFAGSFLGKPMRAGARATPPKPAKAEIALVLDVSGSMRFSLTSDDEAPEGSRRIDALRDGVDALLTAFERNERLEAKVSVIPYSTSVDLTDLFDDAGGNQTQWFEGANGSALPKVCAGGRKGIVKFLCDLISFLSGIDDPSPPGAWGAERYNARNGDEFTLTMDKPASGANRVPVVTQGKRTKSCSDGYIEPFGKRCVELVQVNGVTYVEHDYFAPRSSVLPQTDDSQDVRDFMKTLKPEGATAGHIGAAWGLYALSGDWNDVFNHPAGKPAPFNTDEKKILVIMTDGDFTVAHDQTMTVEDSYKYFQGVCALARENGVEIYTVGLRASELTDTELTKCAGSKGQYFSVGNRSQLVDSFDKIAEKASQIRLTH